MDYYWDMFLLTCIYFMLIYSFLYFTSMLKPVISLINVFLEIFVILGEWVNANTYFLLLNFEYIFVEILYKEFMLCLSHSLNIVFYFFEDLLLLFSFVDLNVNQTFVWMYTCFIFYLKSILLLSQNSKILQVDFISTVWEAFSINNIILINNPNSITFNEV